MHVKNMKSLENEFEGHEHSRERGSCPRFKHWTACQINEWESLVLTFCLLWIKIDFRTRIFLALKIQHDRLDMFREFYLFNYFACYGTAFDMEKYGHDADYIYFVIKASLPVKKKKNNYKVYETSSRRNPDFNSGSSASKLKQWNEPFFFFFF